MATPEDRAAGAVIGALVGDALGLGCHWYYDIDEMRRTFGWVSDYTTPKEGRYHAGLAAGDVSQSGQLLQLLAESVESEGSYDEAGFCQKLDELLATLDGTRSGGRYTQRDMCDVWKARVRDGKPWGQAASRHGDTTDGCVCAAALAARYWKDLGELARTVRSNAALHYGDEHVQIQSMSFGLVLGAIIQGQPYDANLGWFLRDQSKNGLLPFTHAILAHEKAAGETKTRDAEEDLPDPDSLLWPAMCIRAAKDPALSAQPAWKVVQMYGMACSFYMVMPGSYYLAGRYTDDFEMAVLSAINAGGQNLARASLTGAIVGAVNGLSGIPQRFIDGLKDGEYWVKIAKSIAAKGSQNAGNNTITEA